MHPEPEIWILSHTCLKSIGTALRIGSNPVVIIFGWHFARSKFTPTLLLRAAGSGGAFQSRAARRSLQDHGYDTVAQVVAGRDPEVRTLAITAGTLILFRGQSTLHRVTPVSGQSRIVATLSYCETPGVRFSPAEQRGFYGREA